MLNISLGCSTTPPKARASFFLTNRAQTANSKQMKRLFALALLLLSPALLWSAEEKPLARIALLSDPHVTVGTNGLAGAYEKHFETAIAQVNEANVDIVLITGDLSNGGQADQLRGFVQRTKQFQAPVFYVPGNHDVGHKMNSGKTNGFVTVERVNAYEHLMGRSFFAKEQHGMHLIGLDASLFGSGLERERDQWKFIEHEMAEAIDGPKIVFMHYPLFVKSAAEKGGGYWNIEPEPRERLLKLFEQGKVTAVLTGHLHKSLTNDYKGILLLGAPAISFGSPRNAHLEGWVLVQIPKNGPPTFETKRLEQ
jgi:DNA repair exonuclease SbcCD nuclease subunit